jgi:hypothetical protein
MSLAAKQKKKKKKKELTFGCENNIKVNLQILTHKIDPTKVTI